MIVDFWRLINATVIDRRYRRRRFRFTRIERRLFGEQFRWNFRSERAVVTHAHYPVIRHLTDFRARHVPLVENFTHNIFFSALGDDEHAFLRFAQQNFIRRHAWFTFRNFGEVDFDSAAGSAGGFAGRTSETGCAHVLNSCHGVAREKLETRFQQKFFFKRIAYLHSRTILARFFG